MTRNLLGFYWARNLFICCSMLIALPATVAAQTASAPVRLAPILVEADHFEVDLAAERAIWRGSVTAKQGQSTFRAGSLTMHMDQLQRGPGPQQTADDTAANINGYEMSAEKLTYDLGAGRIIGHGNCELRRGEETIRADRIVYQVAEQTAVATPRADGRVQVQFLSDPDKPLFPGSLASSAAAD